ncbi:MAG: hypothetical protein IPN05_19895, partial [Sulfuritalea sp.]|nr:hypothetical protein [Sulfuritalea sp.]
TVSRSITSATGSNFEDLAASTVAASTNITQHHRHHHGEPRQPDRRSPRAATSPTPRRAWAPRRTATCW